MHQKLSEAEWNDLHAWLLEREKDSVSGVTLMAWSDGCEEVEYYAVGERPSQIVVPTLVLDLADPEDVAIDRGDGSVN